jgi:hypothetical protein
MIGNRSVFRQIFDRFGVNFCDSLSQKFVRLYQTKFLAEIRQLSFGITV